MATQRQPIRQTPKRLSTGSRLFFTTSEVAGLFGVCSRTVLRWTRDGLLKCRFQYLGGAFYRRVYLTEEIGRLIDELFPSEDDLSCEHPPGPRKQRVESILRVKRLHQLYSSKARTASVARRLAKAEGLDESEVGTDEDHPQAHDKRRGTLDHGSSARRRSDLDRWNQTEPPSDRHLSDGGWRDSWDDDNEGQR